MTQLVTNRGAARIFQAAFTSAGLLDVRMLLLKGARTQTNGSHTLPQGTITVISTTGFPASGDIFVRNGSGWDVVSYTGTTGTTFTGCTGGSGSISTGADVVQRLPAGARGTAGLDLDTVAGLLAVAGVAEANHVSYGRVALTSEAVTEDDTNDRALFDAADVVFANLDQDTIIAFATYVEGASDAARDLLTIHEGTSEGLPRTANGANFTVQTPNGLLRGSTV